MYKKQSFKLAAIVLTGLFWVSCGQRSSAPPIPVQNVQTDTSTNKSPNPSVVNVFVENSGSMDGYVQGVTEFEQAVYSYISDIKNNSDVCSQMNLYYINSNKIKQPDDVADFIDKLEPAEFRRRGGNRQTTDLSNIIRDVIQDQQDNEINLLITDCVFSPGRGRAAQAYLINQQIGIKGHIANKLKESPNFAVVIYQLQSKFEGKYYNCYDVPTNINDQRPFYIILFGERSRLSTLVKNISSKKIKGSGAMNSYCISNMTETPEYSVLVSPKIGSFKPDPKDAKHSILKAKIDKRNPINPFTLSIGVDFSDFLLDDDYICDISNFTCNNKSYSLEIGKNTGARTVYSHIVKLALNGNIISRGRIDISLNKYRCSWADDMTDEDGENINAGDAMHKTFGLKYMIDGIYEAYSDKNQYTTLTINIK